jgi:hypothetical protein
LFSSREGDKQRGITLFPAHGTLEDTMRYERITLRPEQMGGLPCIRRQG